MPGPVVGGVVGMITGGGVGAGCTTCGVSTTVGVCTTVGRGGVGGVITGIGTCFKVFLAMSPPIES
jgi:hypothetical protein